MSYISPTARGMSSLIVLLVILFVGGMVFSIWNRKPPPPVDQSRIYGCYGSNNGPNWLINEEGLRIDQLDLPPIKTKLEYLKNGEVLVLSKWLRPRVQADGSIIFRNDRTWDSKWEMYLSIFPRYSATGKKLAKVDKIWIFAPAQVYQRIENSDCKNLETRSI